MNAETIRVGAPIPRITAVAPAGGLSVAVTWDNGHADTIDLAPMILAYRAFKPLRDNPDLFAMVAVEEYGTGIRWDDSMDIAHYTLERLADQQRVMDTAAFNAWRESHHLTLDTAAAALGISRRVIAAISSGKRPMDLTTTLACAGYDARVREGEAAE